ncbi:hypothetical protein [Archangium sp.]|jgi:hypothetical protein|uniref:hypothetical protein n=1 Tax=Archangium sp. TaxID=1872627 RepID=UPI002ED85C21
MTKKLLSACLLTSALLTACGNTNEADVEGCEHLKEGPSAAVTATVPPTDNAPPVPAVSNDHKRYDITLPAGTGGTTGNVGSVSFAVSEPSDFVLFLGTNVPVKVTRAGAEVAFEETATSSEECGEVKGRYVVPLQVGTYTLTFGPTSQANVSLVIEETAHDEEHEH